MSGKRTSQLHIDPCYPIARIGMRLLTGYPRLSPVVQDQASAGLQHPAPRSPCGHSQREEYVMNREQSWQVITEQRLALAELLDNALQPVPLGTLHAGTNHARGVEQQRGKGDDKLLPRRQAHESRREVDDHCQQRHVRARYDEQMN